MTKKRFFITGISTEVGKTIASAILTEALEADYWKPIQAGDLEYSDSHKIEHLISNKKSRIHANAYALKTPMSPHAAAEIDQIEIKIDQIQEPKTENHLVIEGAGGLLVPLNNQETILDLIQPEYQVILVSRHYLGSINHTLLSYQLLKQNGVSPAILFIGNEHHSTESIIQQMTNAPILGRIDEEKEINAQVIQKYANQLKPILNEFIEQR